MKKRCGLLGRSLRHSYSPLIHSRLGDYEYSFFEREPEQLSEFILSKEYDAINVTIPYKTEVVEFLDSLSPEAEATGAVNTIKKEAGGELVGYNTDCYGAEYMLRHAGIDVVGKKALILGSGGSSRTLNYVLGKMGASEIVVISRTGENNYENISRHNDSEIIVNTTPVGMYPRNLGRLLSLDGFERLSGVADIIFNPKTTPLLYEATLRGIKTGVGLDMLVAQAKAASEIFTSASISDAVIPDIVKEIRYETENLILEGMAGCGKSTVGKTVAQMLGREFIDTDELITEEAKMSIPEIFARFGEEHFRQLEHRAVCRACARSGCVIALGGGAPTREINRLPIKQNGRVVFLSRSISELSRDGRPLSIGADLYKMYEERRPSYDALCDFKVEVQKHPSITAKLVIEEFKKEIFK